jgi:dipeptidyl aminopeptidase/acylaminoacyl peptidase
MNGNDRLERELTTWFADTAAPQTPDWTAEVIAATATMRQRPRWSFPARWLPPAVAPRLPQLTRRPVPWRTIVVLALLVVLLAAAVTLYVGSRPRLPAPFGPAANGLVAYAELGEIWTVDPVTGDRNKIVSLAGGNQAPRFSRDGTRVAFFRRIEGGELLAITRADGTGLLESKGAPFVGADIDSIVWSPDGRFVAVAADSDLGRAIYLVETSTGEVRDLDTANVDVEPYWRPPDGRELVYLERRGDLKRLFLIDIEGADEDALPMSNPESNLRPGGWTPDGDRFVVHHWDDEHDPWTSLLDPETGEEEALDLAFGRVSNDGTRIVGYRNFREDPFLCVMTLPAGPCDAIAKGPVLPDWEHTAGLQWSPDDRWIVVYPQDNDMGWVLLNPEGGPPITPVWSERGVESWQRKAP